MPSDQDFRGWRLAAEFPEHGQKGDRDENYHGFTGEPENPEYCTQCGQSRGEHLQGAHVAAERRTDLPQLTDRKRLGSCYKLALDFAVKEGWTLHHGTIADGTKSPLDHAWAVDPDGTAAYEPTSDSIYPAEHFERIFHPKSHVSFEGREINENAVEYMHYGPWDSTCPPLKEASALDRFLDRRPAKMYPLMGMGDDLIHWSHPEGYGGTKCGKESAGRVDGQVNCPKCKSRTSHNSDEHFTEDCPWCEASGGCSLCYEAGYGKDEADPECDACGGTGLCSMCKGSAQIHYHAAPFSEETARDRFFMESSLQLCQNCGRMKITPYNHSRPVNLCDNCLKIRRDNLEEVTAHFKEGHVQTRPIRSDPYRLHRALMAEADMARYGSERPGRHPENEDVRSAARDYMVQSGLPYESGEDEYADLDEDRAKRIADAFEGATHSPQDPEVHHAYEAFKQETARQYDHLVNRGYHFEPWGDEGQPYGDSKGFTDDIRRGHLYYYKTLNPDETSFGGDQFQGRATPEQVADNPLLEDSGRPALDSQGNSYHQSYNDLFRAVHDVYGHAKEGNHTGPRGEENAWRQHMRMYSPDARRAMTTETRGQNSWVNFGHHLRRDDGSVPHRGDFDYVPLPDRVFADQKVALLPREFSELPEKSVSKTGSYEGPEIYCPNCGSRETEATGSEEHNADDESVREERECHDCGHYFQWNMDGHFEGKPYQIGEGGKRIAHNHHVEHLHDPDDHYPWTMQGEPIDAWISGACKNEDHVFCPVRTREDFAKIGCDCECHDNEKQASVEVVVDAATPPTLRKAAEPLVATSTEKAAGFLHWLEDVPKHDAGGHPLNIGDTVTYGGDSMKVTASGLMPVMGGTIEEDLIPWEDVAVDDILKVGLGGFFGWKQVWAHRSEFPENSLLHHANPDLQEAVLTHGLKFNLTPKSIGANFSKVLNNLSPEAVDHGGNWYRHEGARARDRIVDVGYTPEQASYALAADSAQHPWYDYPYHQPGLGNRESTIRYAHELKHMQGYGVDLTPEKIEYAQNDKRYWKVRLPNGEMLRDPSGTQYARKMDKQSAAEKMAKRYGGTTELTAPADFPHSPGVHHADEFTSEELARLPEFHGVERVDSKKGVIDILSRRKSPLEVVRDPKTFAFGHSILHPEGGVPDCPLCQHSLRVLDVHMLNVGAGHPRTDSEDRAMRTGQANALGKPFGYPQMYKFYGLYDAGFAHASNRFRKQTGSQETEGGIQGMLWVQHKMNIDPKFRDYVTHITSKQPVTAAGTPNKSPAKPKPVYRCVGPCKREMKPGERMFRSLLDANRQMCFDCARTDKTLIPPLQSVSVPMPMEVPKTATIDSDLQETYDWLDGKKST